MHPSLKLWADHAPQAGYPEGVLPIPKPIPGTAFFPGGYGLWQPQVEDALPAFPVGETMVLGHDFHSKAGYCDSLARGAENETQPTWRNLLELLRSAGMSPDKCFFTNAFMGLRAGEGAVGPFPGATDAAFVEHCKRFLVQQLKAQRPALVMTLGLPAALMLASLSSDLTSWRSKTGFKQIDLEDRPVRFGVKFDDVADLRSTVVALVHPSMRHANVRHRTFAQKAGAQAELAMLLAAYSERAQTS